MSRPGDSVAMSSWSPTGWAPTPSGELASKMACDLIPHNYMKTRVGTPSEAIVKTFRDVSALIHSRATANREFQGMGTTCSSLLLLPEGALIAHVGDSRVYRIRGRRIDQLSFDHSLVWELVRRNHLTSEQAKRLRPQERDHPQPGPGGRDRGRRRGSAGRRARRRVPALLRRAVRPGRGPRARRVRRELSPARRLPIPGQPGEPARRPRQHHGPDRPDRHLGRSRIRRRSPQHAGEKSDQDGAALRNWRQRLTELFKNRKRSTEPATVEDASVSDRRVRDQTRT